MQRSIHLRTIQCGSRRVLNRSPFRTYDLVALVAAVDAWVCTVTDDRSRPKDDADLLVFVTARRTLAVHRNRPRESLRADALPDVRHEQRVHERGTRVIALATPSECDPHANPVLVQSQEGLSEVRVRELASRIARTLAPNDDTRVRTRAEDVPAYIASLHVRARRENGAAAHARVRSKMVLARAGTVEAHAHESVLALQDAAFRVHRAGVRLLTHIRTHEIIRAYHDLITAIHALERNLERARAHLRLPSRPPRLVPRTLSVAVHHLLPLRLAAAARDYMAWCAEDHVPAPPAPVCVASGPHVSALGTLEIENQTVYATADLLALVDRVEAAAARWQGADALPRVARRVQAITPRGHLPRLSFVHVPWLGAPEPGKPVLPLLPPVDPTATTLAFLPLRRPETRTSDPLWMLACGRNSVTRRDLGLLAQRVAMVWHGGPKGRDWMDPRGLRLRVSRHASTSLCWGGPTARRRATQACAEVRVTLEALEVAITAALSSEARIHGLLRALRADDHPWSVDSALRARLADLETMLERAECWVDQPSFRA